MELPLVGLGTWRLTGEECTRVVEMGLELGYRHLDTAHSYDNHGAIAKGMQRFDRSQLFITSKLALQEQIDLSSVEQSLKTACEKALSELKTDYLDLYLIHFPTQNFPLEQIFESMEKLKEQGKVSEVGVSNYTLHHLEDLAHRGLVPYANQIEFHPYLNQREMSAYCRTHQIKIISFRPFGKGRLLEEEPLFNKIGVFYGKTGAQVILRWLIQNGISVIPKASSEQHLKENLNIFDFSLSAEEMNKLDELNHGKRYCMGDREEYGY